MVTNALSLSPSVACRIQSTQIVCRALTAASRSVFSVIPFMVSSFCVVGWSDTVSIGQGDRVIGNELGIQAQVSFESAESHVVHTSELELVAVRIAERDVLCSFLAGQDVLGGEGFSICDDVAGAGCHFVVVESLRSCRIGVWWSLSCLHHNLPE